MDNRQHQFQMEFAKLEDRCKRSEEGFKDWKKV